MANIFSGVMNAGRPSGSNSAAGLAQYKQQLDEYELKRARYQREQDVRASQPEFEATIKDMTPERQAQARMFRKMTTLQSMGDQGLAGFNKTVEQRGTTLRNISDEAEKLKRHNAERDYDLAHPESTDYEKNLAAFRALGTDKSREDGVYSRDQIEALQFQGREKFIDTGIAEVSSIDPEKAFEYKFAEKAMREGMGDKQTDQYLGFQDTVAASDTFMTNMLRKREAVQQLHGMSTDSNMGWETIFALAPGTSQRTWQAVRDEVVANIGIDELMKMKDSSPTGASGLGQLSDTEMRILTALVGKLEQAGTPEQARRILQKIDAQYGDMERNRKIKLRRINRQNRAFENTYDKSIPEQFRYEIDDSYKYLLDDDFTKPGRESPLIKKETPEERDQRLFGG